MNILVLHNSYQIYGGEDSVVKYELDLLSRYGNTSILHLLENGSITGWRKAISTAFGVSHSKLGYEFSRKILAETQPDVAHIHNFFPLLSPAEYEACQGVRVPVVQTLHNYRTICPGALLMKEGQICEKCVTSNPYQAVLHGCYRNSRLGTLAVARMVDYHRRRNTWGTKVDRFIALTEFAKKKFVEAGFPEHKIAVKPNFYSGAGVANHAEASESRVGALFVGRMSQEKGIRTLLSAWRQLSIPLKMAGGGPLLDEVRNAGLNTVETFGLLPPEQVSSALSRAAFLVLPSECYENFPLTLAEAFAHGLPVVASRLGAMAEIVEDGVTGLHFELGNADDLAAKVRWMNNHPDECRQMGYNARRVFEQNYTPDRNYEMLMKIYREAIDEKKQSRQS